MPPDVHPSELAALLDFAERPRVGDWSLRAALTRYAQPEPQRVGALFELIRRVDFAAEGQRDQIAAEGEQLWASLPPAGAADRPDGLAGLLAAGAVIDRLGDLLAAWADDPSTTRPDEAVDAVIGDVAERLDALGVAREERRPPRGGRG